MNELLVNIVKILTSYFIPVFALEGPDELLIRPVFSSSFPIA